MSAARSTWLGAVADCGLLPDWMLRIGMRRLIAGRLREEGAGDADWQRARLGRHVAQLRTSPIALATGAANEQHYEVPAAFFDLVLGRHRKYSCCWWEPGDTLDRAEERMLAMTAERAGIVNGESILDLGCGWGAFSLYAARQFPQSRVVAVSNSQSQRAHIERTAAAAGVGNLQVITADINDFDAGRRFDRIVSVEMLEHVRNYGALFKRIAGWMLPGGSLFVHIFAHRQFAYPFEVRGAGDWMAERFFTGGQMPSEDLFTYFQDDLRIRRQWAIDGKHYQKTAEAWLVNLDRHRREVLELFGEVYGAREAERWLVRWRLFFMACAELFGYRDGSEWRVSHYRFEPAGAER